MNTATQLATIDPAWAWQPFVPGDRSLWNRRLAAHLFRRAAFGASLSQLDEAVKQQPVDVVQQLLRGSPPSADSEKEIVDLARTVVATGNPRQLASWWTYLLSHTGHPLRERLTLFWHGHFATSADKVTDATLMLDQNQLLRRHALGDFRALVHAISRDPAMLIYLDSATNRKAHPNENYARELMELFCMGEGHYSEKDVQELARCFTGWEVKLKQFRFNRFQHDSGTKSILGRTDKFTDGEVIDWVVDHPQTARFIVGKLFRLFICDEPEPPAELIEPLAEEFREHNYHVQPVVQRMLASQLFFSPLAVGRKIRSPVDLAIGLLRSLDGSANAQQLAAAMQQNGHGLFYPPNVKGWDGGRSWINASTVLGRANMVGQLLRDEKTRFASGQLHEYLARSGATDGKATIDLLEELLLAAPLSPAARTQLLDANDRQSDPHRRAIETLHALATLPEFQLG